MKTIEELNKSNLPIIPIDKSLNKYKTKNLFSEKLAKANEIIAIYGLPKIVKNT
jgi:ATP/maltotriose-dependent transcriptional regulator MalT